jgi:two-component system response regulator FixJ
MANDPLPRKSPLPCSSQNTRPSLLGEGPARIVFIVDNDEPSRDALSALVGSMGLQCHAFESAEEFLAVYELGRRGCVLAEVRMLGMSGLELLDEIGARGFPLPTVILTAYVRTAMIVRAMKAGAVTVLEKPWQDDELWDAVRLALAEEARLYARYEGRRQIRGRLALLTLDERRVMQHIVAGVPNKGIARVEGVSVRTIETRRRAIFSKMQATSLVELVRMTIEADLFPLR